MSSISLIFNVPDFAALDKCDLPADTPITINNVEKGLLEKFQVIVEGRDKDRISQVFIETLNEILSHSDKIVDYVKSAGKLTVEIGLKTRSLTILSKEASVQLGFRPFNVNCCISTLFAKMIVDKKLDLKTFPMQRCIFQDAPNGTYEALMKYREDQQKMIEILTKILCQKLPSGYMLSLTGSLIVHEESAIGPLQISSKDGLMFQIVPPEKA